jgi:pimeloyl-ACP methyl ester carboxylesterase
MGEISPAIYRAGEGEPVVLMHGFSGTWRHWKPVLADLVARYEVIAPTATGHSGGPPVPPGMVFTLQGAADRTEQHLDELGIGTAHFVGNSMGGGIAIELAKRGRARSVVGLSPAGGWDPATNEAKRLARFFTVQMQMAKRSERILPRLVSRPGSRREMMRMVMRRGDLVHPVDALGMAKESIDCAIYDDAVQRLRTNVAHITDLDQVRAPVLLAWAEKDRILPMSRHSQRFRDEIPGVEFSILAGCGHVPMWDDPRAVVAAITGHVDRHTAGAKPEPALA